MIVALERNAFINFFKSGFVKIAIERRVNFSLDKLIKWEADVQYNLLEPIIPEFEEEQDIVFIEFKKNAINNLVLQFEDVLKIFNSTEHADFLNAGKFNPILKIDQPYFSNAFERIKLNRNYKGKQVVNEFLKRIFLVFGDSHFDDFIYKSLFNDKQSNFIKSLIAYNVTPGILPQGNLEFILKVGLAIFDWKGSNIDKFEKGDYYKNLVPKASAFGNKSLYEDYEVFFSLVKKNQELELAYNKIINMLSDWNSDFDLYKIAYFYLGFKFMILKADTDISNDLVLYNLAELKIKDQEIFVQVIHLLSRTFSFNELYEGIYKLLDIAAVNEKESCMGMLESFYSKLKNKVSETLQEESLQDVNSEVVISQNLSNNNSFIESQENYKSVKDPIKDKNILEIEKLKSNVVDIEPPKLEIIEPKKRKYTKKNQQIDYNKKETLSSQNSLEFKELESVKNSAKKRSK